MINKKYVFIILFISILSISAAYASENITQDVVSVELDDSIEISNDEGSNLMQIPETENTQTIDETENNLTANNEKEIIADDENSNLMQIPESENAQTIYETENNLTANNEKEIIADDENATHYGYWVWSKDMPYINLTELSEHGVTDLFLNYFAYTRFNQSYVETFVADANEKGIGVHIWAQIFYYDGHWTRPIINGTVNQEFFNEKIAEIETYARSPGVRGIHFDYLRFSGIAYYNNTAKQNPGGMEAITEFVKQASTAIRNINPDLIVSAAIMPEPDSLKDVYGDDYEELSKYLDVALPMVYVGNYRQTTAWVENTTKWFVENSQGAKVWTGLQLNISDDDETPIPVSKVNMDIQSAFKGDAAGIILFKITDITIDFTNITVNEKEIASLSYLKYLISTPPQSNEIILDNDFIYTEEFDANLTDIDLNCENIVIDGNNHVINGLNKIAFTVSANNVTLKNIKFINCAKENTKIVIGATITRQAIDTEAGEKGGMLYATLTDNNGKPLINKNVQIVYNGKIYNRTTDNQGRAGMKISFTTPSTYTYVFAFQGDNNYNAAPLAVTQLKIIQKKTTISAVSKAFTLKAKKTISVTLKTVQNEYDKKTYLNAGKPITLKINGKTYTGKINKNGVAKFSVTLVKKGKYTAAIKFAGDQIYKASSKSIKITII